MNNISKIQYRSIRALLFFATLSAQAQTTDYESDRANQVAQAQSAPTYITPAGPFSEQNQSNLLRYDDLISTHFESHVRQDFFRLSPRLRLRIVFQDELNDAHLDRLERRLRLSSTRNMLYTHHFAFYTTDESQALSESIQEWHLHSVEMSRNGVSKILPIETIRQEEAAPGHAQACLQGRSGLIWATLNGQILECSPGLPQSRREFRRLIRSKLFDSH